MPRAEQPPPNHESLGETVLEIALGRRFAVNVVGAFGMVAFVTTVWGTRWALTTFCIEASFLYAVLAFEVSARRNRRRNELAD